MRKNFKVVILNKTTATTPKTWKQVSKHFISCNTPCLEVYFGINTANPAFLWSVLLSHIFFSSFYFQPIRVYQATQFIVGGAHIWTQVCWILKHRPFISTPFVFRNYHMDLWDHIRSCRRTYLPGMNSSPSCAVNSFLPRSSGFSTRRRPNTEVVYVTLDNESDLQMMTFGPLLLSLIMSNLYISHRSCRLIYRGGGKWVKTY